MHRIDTPTAQVDKFGQGKNGFTNGDPATGRRATDLNSDMWDAVQEEVCAVIEQSGLTLDKSQHDQLYKAIMQLIAKQIPDALLKKNNLSDVIDKALARANLELKSAATHDVTASNLDTTSGRLVQVGDYGIGGDTISLPGNVDIHSYFTGKPTGKYRGGANITGTAYPNKPWYEFDWMSHINSLYGFLVEYTADGFSAIHILNNGTWGGIYYVLTSAGGSFNSTFKFGRVETIPTEQNMSALFNQTGGADTIVAGAEFTWYGNKIKAGIARDASTGTRGFYITLNGNKIFTVDPAGSVTASGSMISMQGDERKHFTIMNADGTARFYLWKDKGGDGVHLSNGPDGGGDFVFGKDGGFYAPSTLHAGSAQIGTNGDIYGSVWGGWFSGWLTGALNAKISGAMRGAQGSMTMDGGMVEAPPGCFLTGGNGNEGSQVGVALYRPLQVYVNGGWATIGG